MNGIGFLPRCYFCKHLHRPLGKVKTCNAFPERIPDEIFFDSAVEHLKPYEGDHGIQFELDTTLSAFEIEIYHAIYDK